MVFVTTAYKMHDFLFLIFIYLFFFPVVIFISKFFCTNTI